MGVVTTELAPLKTKNPEGAVPSKSARMLLERAWLSRGVASLVFLGADCKKHPLRPNTKPNVRIMTILFTEVMTFQWNRRRIADTRIFEV
jgi:hypothetical protein